ncbi:MAG TPA: hypothetical protein VF067_05135 [Sphingomicrobium sp.]
MTDSNPFPLGGLSDQQSIDNRSDEIRNRARDSDGLIGSLGWDAVRNLAASKLTEGLANEDGLKWLSYGWGKAKAVRAAALESLEEGAGDRRVPLASHPISQEIHPVVTLRLGTAKLDMEFTIELKADVECVDLVLRNGRLVAVEAGSLTPSASLSFKEIGIAEKRWKTINFPQIHQLPDGGWQIVDGEPS